MIKKIKLTTGLVSLASILMVSNGLIAFADETEVPTNVTPVGVLDRASSDVKLKIQIPNINDKDTLAFSEVPDAFDFGLMEVDSSIENVSNSIRMANTKLSVYKDYARDDKWEVKAVASDLTDGKNMYQLNEFKLNDQKINGTGSSPIILESVEGKNGIGTYSYDIDEATIDVKLPKEKKEGITHLTGNVTYSLTVTSAAE